MLVRLARGVTDHFPARASEWVLAGMITHWGVIVLQPDNLFARSPAYQQMALLADEKMWGYSAIAIGFTRFVALVINGTFSSTWYGRWSPHVRSVLSGASCFFWTQISLGIWAADVNTTGLAIYPWLTVLDIWNAIRASNDAGKMDESRTDGRT